MNSVRLWILFGTGVFVGALAILPRIGRLFSKPLRVGDRVRLRGGHQEPPPWLQGRSHVEGRVTATVLRDGQLCHEVTLDTPLERDGTRYEFALMQLRFADAKWVQHAVVHLELWADTPRVAIPESGEVRHEYVESHAVYRVIAAGT